MAFVILHILFYFLNFFLCGYIHSFYAVKNGFKYLFRLLLYYSNALFCFIPLKMHMVKSYLQCIIVFIGQL